MFKSAPIQQSPRGNRLLASLPAIDYARLLPDLELVTLPLGDVIYEPGSHLRNVYFPTTAIVSLLYVMKDGGASAEIAIVGNDGMIGISRFLGGETTPSRAVVQNEGYAYRLADAVLKREFKKFGALSQLLLMYLQALVTQMSQTAVCNRHHKVDEQFCRWLLLSLDRLPSNDLTMTIDLIANMLGLTVDEAMTRIEKLKTAGLLTYVHGQISVSNRPGVERRACECYAVVKQETDRLLPLPGPVLVEVA